MRHNGSTPARDDIENCHPNSLSSPPFTAEMLSKIAEEVEVADGIKEIILENGQFPTKMLIKGIEYTKKEKDDGEKATYRCKQYRGGKNHSGCRVTVNVFNDGRQVFRTEQDPQTNQMVLVPHSCKQVATLQTAKITQVLDVKADQKNAIETRIQEFTGMTTTAVAFKISGEFTKLFQDNKDGITGFVCYSIPQLKELVRRTRASEFGDWQSNRRMGTSR